MHETDPSGSLNAPASELKRFRGDADESHAGHQDFVLADSGKTVLLELQTAQNGRPHTFIPTSGKRSLADCPAKDSTASRHRSGSFSCVAPGHRK